MRSEFDSIEGLEPAAPIGYRVTVGRKSPKGEPIEKDRFYILDAVTEMRDFPKKDGGVYRSRQAPESPEFEAWNALARRGDKRASTIYGHVAFVSAAESWHFKLDAPELRHHKSKNEKLPPVPGGGTWEKPPLGRPACEGNGREALRFAGLDRQGNATYSRIVCPNQLCPFRQEINGKVDCKAWGRFYFMLRWPESKWPQGHGMARVLAKLVTRSGESVANIEGFFDYVKRFAAEAGIEHPNLMGLPFSLTVAEKTSSAKKRRYPVLTITPDGDLVDFFSRQVQRLQLAAGSPRLALTQGAMSPAENESRIIALDYASIIPGPDLPARTEEPEEPSGPVTETPEPEPDPDPAEPAQCVPDASAAAKQLAVDLRRMVKTKEEAEDLLADLLKEEGRPGPRSAAGLTFDQIATARERLKAHPLAQAQLTL